MEKILGLARENMFRVSTMLLIGVCVLFAVLYGYGGLVRMEKVNTDMYQEDQSANMWYAKELYDRNLLYAGDGCRSPLYPFIQSLFHGRQMDWESFLVQGKSVHLVLSFIILAVIFFIFRLYLSLDQAVALIGITAFTVFLFRSSYVNPAQLYYLLSFATFVLMCKMFISPNLIVGALCGICAGLAYLTKFSMAPAIGIFAGVFSVQELYLYLAPSRWAVDVSTFRARMRRLASLGLVLLLFILVITPQIVANKRTFGRCFYNVNTYFYMWYDSWEDAELGTKAYGDREGWPKMAPEDIPSAAKYWREHTADEISWRWIMGILKYFVLAVTSYGWFKYVLLLGALAVAGIAMNVPASLTKAREHIFLLLFVICYFTVYMAGFIWFAAICAAPRYILELFLPYVFSCAIMINIAFDESYSFSAWGKTIRYSEIWGFGLLAILCLELYPIMSSRILLFP
jgi:hypothetical protein